jgi:hypothetical protein
MNYVSEAVVVGGVFFDLDFLFQSTFEEVVDREFPDLSPNGGFCESVAYLISLLAGSFSEKRGPHPNNVDPTTYSH